MAPEHLNRAGTRQEEGVGILPLSACFLLFCASFFPSSSRAPIRKSLESRKKKWRWKDNPPRGRDGVRDERRRGGVRPRGGGWDRGVGPGGLHQGHAQRGVGQHERQDVMVYSAQDGGVGVGGGRQGVRCPQHQPRRDL